MDKGPETRQGGITQRIKSDKDYIEQMKGSYVSKGAVSIASKRLRKANLHALCLRMSN
jgi:hypothetical protein